MSEGKTRSPALEAQLQIIRDELKNRRRSIARIGRAINVILDQDLVDPAEYANPRKLFTQEFPDLGADDVELYSALARAFSDDAIAGYGPDKLRRALTLAAALKKPISQDPADFEVPVAGKKKKFADCTEKELRDALTELKGRKASKRPKADLPPAVAEQLARLHRISAEDFGTGAKIDLTGEVDADGEPMLRIELPFRIAARFLPKAGEALVPTSVAFWPRLVAGRR